MSKEIQGRNLGLGLSLFLSIMGFFFFSVLDSEAKYAGQMYSPLTISFYLRISASVQMLGITVFRCVRKKSFSPFRVINPASQIIRGAMIFVVTYVFTNAFILLPLSNTYTVIFTLPICSAIFGKLFFKEHISRGAGIAIAVGFLGVLIALRPGSTALSIGYLFAIVGVLVEAPMFLMIRKFHKHDHPLSIIMYPSLIATLVYVIIHAAEGFTQLQLFSPFHLLLFFSMGTANLLAQYCIAVSLQNLPTSISLSMQYTQIIWGLLFDALIFHKVELTIYYIIGTIIIIGCSYTVSQVQSRTQQ